jgi:hypothetical protein
MSFNDDDLLATPRDFADEAFAAANRLLFDEYIEHRVQGISSGLAFRTVFGEEYVDNLMMARIIGLERNRYYVINFKKRLNDIPLKELWNPKTSIHELLTLVRDKMAKETARLNAIKELNVLCAITIVDENGKTKAGRSLDDFYNTEGSTKEAKEPTPGEDVVLTVGAPHTTH